MAYRGRATRAGNSQAIAFEKALFRAHPEFSEGRIVADYIGPGTLLVRADEETDASDEDPLLGAFLSFIERSMSENPERIRPLPPELLAAAMDLVGHIEVDLDEDLGDAASLP